MIGFDDLVLLSSEAAIVALGGVLVYVSMRAYRRNKSKSMLAMSIGFIARINPPYLNTFFCSKAD